MHRTVLFVEEAAVDVKFVVISCCQLIVDLAATRRNTKRLVSVLIEKQSVIGTSLSTTKEGPLFRLKIPICGALFLSDMSVKQLALEARGAERESARADDDRMRRSLDQDKFKRRI